MDTVPDGTVSPETSVMTAQRNQVLRDTVAKLTNPAVWTVMEQHYFAERSLKEIAASLDMSESRASQLHNLGLNALRRTMKKRHLGADDFAIGHEVPTQYSAHSL
jgi:RNA polymerase sigma factor (sigma-70 family)